MPFGKFEKTPLRIGWFILAGLIHVALFYSYTYFIFGEFVIPYRFEFDQFFRTEMAKGFQGIHWPRLPVLYFITIHPFQGLFLFFSRFVAGFSQPPAPFEAQKFSRFSSRCHSLRPCHHRLLPLQCRLLSMVGSSTTAPRLLCPAIPFFLPLLALWARNWSRRKAILLTILGTISIASNFMIAAVNPKIEPGATTEQLLSRSLHGPDPESVSLFHRA